MGFFKSVDYDLPREMIEKLPFGIIVFNFKGEAIFFNDKYLEILELPKELAFKTNYNFEDQLNYCYKRGDYAPEISYDELLINFFKENDIEQGSSSELTLINEKWIVHKHVLLNHHLKMMIYENVNHPPVNEINLQDETQSLQNNLITFSHNIRTPINIVMGMLHLIQSREVDFQTRADLFVIEESCASLMAIVNNILEFEKNKFGQMHHEQNIFSLIELIRRLGIIFNLIAQQKGINLEIKVENGLDLLVGDGSRLEQVLNNFISNAIKYSNKGEVTLNIETINKIYDENIINLRFSVSDQGDGLSQESIDTLFQPYSRIQNKTNKNIEGYGLGLSIVKKMTEVMGGKVGVKSIPGNGSTFWANIPFKMCEDNTNVSKLTQLEGMNLKNKEALKGLKIIIIDDSLMNLRVLKRILEQVGAEVLTFESGHEVIPFLQKSSVVFDLILSDLQMPYLDGYEVAIAIHAIESYREIPIIAITAGASLEVKKRAFDVGMIDFVTKPINPNNLISLIEKHLASKLIRQKNEMPAHEIELNIKNNGKLKYTSHLSDAIERIFFENLKRFIVSTPRYNRSLDSVNDIFLHGFQYSVDAIIKSASLCNSIKIFNAARDLQEVIIEKNKDLMAVKLTKLYELILEEFPTIDIKSNLSIKNNFTDWPNISDIDSKVSKEQMSGDIELFMEMIQLFIKENTGKCEEIRILLKSGKNEEASRLAHKLSGQASALGALEVGECAKELSHKLLVNEQEEFSGLLIRLDARLSLLLGNMGLA